MKLSSRLTYANVASTLALVVALGGGGAAVAAGLAKNSVGTKQLKADAVTSAKVKKDTLTGQDVKESTLGKVPSAATADTATTAARAGNVHSALVQSNGALVAGQSLDAASSSKQGTGTYEVMFDRDITDCAPVASIVYPGSALFSFPGLVTVTGLENEPNGLFVTTAGTDGTSADRPFSVLVVC